MLLREMRWPLFRRVQRQAALMDQMMQVLGVDMAAAARKDRSEAFARARAECLNCSISHQCDEWLETVEANAAPPSFCPNAGFFREFTTARH